MGKGGTSPDFEVENVEHMPTSIIGKDSCLPLSLRKGGSLQNFAHLLRKLSTIILSENESVFKRSLNFKHILNERPTTDMDLIDSIYLARNV